MDLHIRYSGTKRGSLMSVYFGYLNQGTRFHDIAKLFWYLHCKVSRIGCCLSNPHEGLRHILSAKVVASLWPSYERLVALHIPPQKSKKDAKEHSGSWNNEVAWK